VKEKSVKDRIHEAILLARKVAKGIDKADRTYRKLVHLKTEARPASRKHLSASKRKRILLRDKGRCVKCGSKKNLEIDHVVPLARGGSNRLENLQLLCQECNRSKGVD
jgi:5-methylcytosine-specific restriction endonuclease McrA